VVCNKLLMILKNTYPIEVANCYKDDISKVDLDELMPILDDELIKVAN
ncbi:25202_t:CDS:2, partial [Racocetra persica]